MGRFSWLELGGQSSAENDAQALPGMKELDEQACLATASDCMRKGQYETALQWYSRALRFVIDLEEAWLGQVQCLLFLKEYAEANIWADRALERFQNSPDILAAKATAVGQVRGVPVAMPYSDASLEVKGRAVGPFPWIVRGDLMIGSRSSRQAAIRCFNKAIELAGKDWYTYYLIGTALIRKNRYDQALMHLTTGLNLEHNSALLHCAIGECRERLGEVKQAKLAYQRAREADPLCKLAKERFSDLEHIGPLRRIIRKIIRRG